MSKRKPQSTHPTIDAIVAAYEDRYEAEQLAKEKARREAQRAKVIAWASYAIAACAAAGLLSGCTVMPDRGRVELSHDSHATTGSMGCSSNCSEDGLSRVSIILKWQRGPLVIEAGEGWNIKGRNGGGFYGPSEVFTARVGYEFNLKR